MSRAPWRVRAGDPEIADLLALIQESFAYMEGRIDPPSSMHHLTRESIAAQCQTGEVWAIGTPPLACVFLEARADSLYLGKLCVRDRARGQGLARRLVDLAEARAREHGLKYLELQTRIELIENHASFARLGFEKTGETAHPGYARPTSITMRRAVAT